MGKRENDFRQEIIRNSKAGQMLSYILVCQCNIGDIDIETKYKVLIAFMAKRYQEILDLMQISDFGIVEELKKGRQILIENGFG